jgi:hypothetical protein
MTRPAYGVLLFYSTSWAVRAEKVLQGAGLEVKLIPVPRHLSSDCGVALRFEWPHIEEVRSLLETAGVEVDGFHQM